eukprot:jgi/Bigna1/126502/aug1.2_g1210
MNVSDGTAKMNEWMDSNGDSDCHWLIRMSIPRCWSKFASTLEYPSQTPNHEGKRRRFSLDYQHRPEFRKKWRISNLAMDPVDLPNISKTGKRNNWYEDEQVKMEIGVSVEGEVMPSLIVTPADGGEPLILSPGAHAVGDCKEQGLTQQSKSRGANRNPVEIGRNPLGGFSIESPSSGHSSVGHHRTDGIIASRTPESVSPNPSPRPRSQLLGRNVFIQGNDGSPRPSLDNGSSFIHLKRFASDLSQRKCNCIKAGIISALAVTVIVAVSLFLGGVGEGVGTGDGAAQPPSPTYTYIGVDIRLSLTFPGDVLDMSSVERDQVEQYMIDQVKLRSANAITDEQIIQVTVSPGSIIVDVVLRDAAFGNRTPVNIVAAEIAASFTQFPGEIIVGGATVNSIVSNRIPIGNTDGPPNTFSNRSLHVRRLIDECKMNDTKEREGEEEGEEEVEDGWRWKMYYTKYSWCGYTCQRDNWNSLPNWLSIPRVSDATVNFKLITSMNGIFSTIPQMDMVETYNQMENCPYEETDIMDWHDRRTWNGGLPSGNSHVTLPENTKVLISSCSLKNKYKTITVPESSQLIFSDANTNLRVSSIYVYGKLRVGSPTCRIRSKVTITLTGNAINNDEKGIIAFSGSMLDIHGMMHQPTWTSLAKRANIGDKVLWLQRCVGWAKGDQIVITTTEYKDFRGHNFNEKGVLKNVACKRVIQNNQQHLFGKLTMIAPIKYRHYAADKEYQAEVAVLTRNIKIEGDVNDSPPTDTTNAICYKGDFEQNLLSTFPCKGKYLTAYGGHIRIEGAAVGRVASVEFHRMGQTNRLGKYPLHFHLMGTNGFDSYATDNSVHESYYRCIVAHGTTGLTISRNVAFDAIGMCIYMESGIEERNKISFNLAAHVHSIDLPPMYNTQEQDDKYESNSLRNPADVSASPFYITNMYNEIAGNSAVGGWSGFAAPTLPKVIGEQRASKVTPHKRPTLTFNGNMARSTGYWSKLGGCIYIGGFLEERDSDKKLVYNGGRNVQKNSVNGGKRDRRSPEDSNGNKVWNRFTNLKLSLCSVAGTDWNQRGKWYKIDVLDHRDRSFNAFGEVTFTDCSIYCRTNNGLNLLPVTSSSLTSLERRWENKDYMAFRMYDTGQKHIMSNFVIKSCNNASKIITNGRGRVWTIPLGKNIQQFQTIIKNTTYVETPYPSSLVAWTLADEDRYGVYFLNFLDIDGSATQRSKPTIVGSSGQMVPGKAGITNENANLWWKTTRGSTKGCDHRPNYHLPCYLCNMESFYIASLELYVGDKSIHSENNYEKEIGKAAHWGDNNLGKNGVPMSGDPQIAGPFDHSHQGGWFIQYHGGAPKRLEIKRMQIPHDRTLMIAISYPKNTEFTIISCAAYSSGVCREDKSDIAKQKVFSEVSSIQEVRSSRGDVYYWDNQKGLDE